jgi:cysteine desulfurase
VLNFPLYFDSHATTPCDPRVVEAMLPYFTERFGNAASRHHPFGWAAREAADHARGQIAALLGAKPKDIVFTSGATESNNLAIKGIAEALGTPAPASASTSSSPGGSGSGASGRRGRHIVTVETEHRAVLDPCAWLESSSGQSVDAAARFEVTRLPVNADGIVDLDRLIAALRPETILVSVMAANNEIGVLQPLEAIGRETSARGIAFHTDASQAVGKVPIDVEAIRADLVSFTAHKIYGPKGVGALYVRRRGPAAALAPLIHGGGHERRLRSGTLNVPAIVGFGAAAASCASEMAADASRLGALRDRLLAGLRAGIQDLRVNGSLDARLPHNLNVTIDGVDGGTLLMAITDIALSSGAACSSASAEPSHVLRALGLSDAQAKASLRLGLGRYTTPEEVDFVITRLSSIVADLRRQALARRV